jgi:hypothetical protein
MENQNNNTINQFDVVRLITSKNVRYLSGPTGRATSPQGEWSVVGFVDGEALLAKQTTIIKVPISDIAIIASYDINNIKNHLVDNIASIDIVISVTRLMNVTYEHALSICKKFKIPLRVDSKEYEEKALQKLKECLNKQNKIGE